MFVVIVRVIKDYGPDKIEDVLTFTERLNAEVWLANEGFTPGAGGTFEHTEYGDIIAEIY